MIAGGILGLLSEGKVHCLLMRKMLREGSERVEIKVTMLDLLLCAMDQCQFRDEFAL